MKKSHELIGAAVIAAMLALEGWTLTAVVDLKVQVAEIKTQMLTLGKTTIANERHHANTVTLNP